MISQTPPATLAKTPLSDECQQAATDSQSSKKIDRWIEKATANWQKTVNIAKANPTHSSLTKKQTRRYLFGLDSRLLEKLTPFVEHLNSRGNAGPVFEQLAEIAESVGITLQTIAPSLESHRHFESTDVSNEAQSVAAFTSLLIATQLRDLIIRGNDSQFERTIRSLQNLSQLHFGVEQSEGLLLQQWIGIELPMLISSQLGAFKPFRKLGKQAAKRFVVVTRNLMDSDGWPHHGCLKDFGALVASWTRCVKLANACDFKLDTSFQIQLEWLAEQFVRMHNCEGKLFFSNIESPATDPEFVKFVLSLSKDNSAKQAAISGGLLRSKNGKSKSNRQIETNSSCVSEWSESAVLKSSWGRNSPAMAIDFSKSQSHLEVAVKEVLIRGKSTIEISDDGAPVALGNEGFNVVCELEDDDVSYLELELQLESVSIFRQILLSKTEQFLFFADSVHKSGAGLIDYKLSLPVANGIDVIRENGTREMYLSRKGKGIRSLMLPLSLPEWTTERCRGLFAADTDSISGESQLIVEQSTQLQPEGGALYCPIFFDLDPKRSRQKRTWRRLTVAESLKIVRPEIAAAFRVQVAEQQWIFYRALQSIQNRTFFGQNFAGDFFAGQFNRNGKVNELVQVQ